MLSAADISEAFGIVSRYRRLLEPHDLEIGVYDASHARGYLSSAQYNDGEVSFLLGFEDPTSFYRAFRGWTGMSPHEFRRQAHMGV